MASTITTNRNSLVKVGGALGIAGCFISLAVFLMALFGFNAVLMLSPLPVVLGLIGLVMSVIGAVKRTHAGDEETQPISALFVTLTAIIGGTIEWYLWCHLR